MLNINETRCIRRNNLERANQQATKLQIRTVISAGILHIIAQSHLIMTRLTCFICATGATIFLLLAVCHTAESSYKLSAGSCDVTMIRKSCLLGCMRCAIAFGHKTYDMNLCCAECAINTPVMVDNGPEICSDRFLTTYVKNLLIKRRTNSAATDRRDEMYDFLFPPSDRR